MALGEIMYENISHSTKLSMLNLIKNRVTATQFASSETIANTPHSPRYSNIIHYNAENSNISDRKFFKKFPASLWLCDKNKNAIQEMYQGVPKRSLANTTRTASGDSIPENSKKVNTSDEISSAFFRVKTLFCSVPKAISTDIRAQSG